MDDSVSISLHGNDWVGPMIKIRLIGDNVVEGTVFTVDPVTFSIVIREKDDTFTLVNHSQIISLDGDLDFRKLPSKLECGPNVNSLEKLEAKAQDQAERNMSSINFTVSHEVQTLFDRLNFIFPCEWNETSIIILNEFTVDPPYSRVQSLQNNSSDSSGLERVSKVLEGERRKLNL